MSNYIDGFVFPISKKNLEQYKHVAEQVAVIWKEHGATAYFEFVGDELVIAGTRSFTDLIACQEDEVVIFGWVAFESKEIRVLAHEKVASDSRMEILVAPLMEGERKIFDAERMGVGGFSSLVG